MVELSPEDKRLNVEGRLLDKISNYGGKRLVAGKDMSKLLQDLTDEVYRLKADGLLDD